MTKYIDINTVSMIGKPANALHPRVYAGRINDKLKAPKLSNIKFNGFVGEWKGHETYCEMECSEHGTWECTVGNFTHQTVGCPACIGRKNHTNESICESVKSIITNDSERNMYIFHGIHKFAGKDSILSLECPTHGIWNTTSYNNFRVHGYGCPECSNYHLKHDVKSDNKLYFYILKSEDHFKLGVSKDITRRKYDIENTSKRKYELYLHKYIGYTNEIEKYIKSMGYRTFFTKEEYGDGYTETVAIDKLDEVVKIVREYLK